jgi:DNA-directed RNA polymerase specialized sigma24 family protein
MGVSAISLDVGISSLGRKIKKFREQYQHLISAVRYSCEGRGRRSSMIEQLYRQHYRQLLRFCISLTINPAFAEDIVQDAFMRAMAHADLLQDLPEPKCLAWLYKTVRNLFIDQVRRLAKAPKDE